METSCEALPAFGYAVTGSFSGSTFAWYDEQAGLREGNAASEEHRSFPRFLL